MDKIIDLLIRGTRLKTGRLQKFLFDFLLDYLVDNLFVDDNVIEYSESNIKAVAGIDNRLNNKLKKSIEEIDKGIKKGIEEVMNETVSETLGESKSIIPEAITNKVLSHANKTVDSKISLEAAYVEIKGAILSELSSYEGTSLKTLKSVLAEKIKGRNLINKHFDRWTGDIYYQYQRATANEVRKKLGYRFAIYQGGLIATSRHWCGVHNNTVLHESEIESWFNEEWQGKNEINYNPFYDCGGYNCRHRWRWITDELAFFKNPKLEQKYGSP